MFVSRLACNGIRQGVFRRSANWQVVKRRYASGPGGRSTLRRPTTKAGESGATVPGETAFGVGQGVAAGAALLGIGGLCYYGLGLSSEAGAIDKAAFWSPIVKDRIKATYGYFGASLALTAGSAVAVSRTPALMNLVSRGGWMSLIACIGAMWGSGMYCQSLPYTEGIGQKQLAWALHSAIVGGVIAPMAMLGGPVLVKAAVYTAGMVAGLSLTALCAPSEKFLNMGGPLAMGLGVVFMSSVGSMFLPPTGALGASLYSMAIYGGLVLFGMFMLYDTQKIIKRAETTPTYAARPYDPINNSIGIYLDTINIFVRIATIMAGGGGRRK